MSAGRSIGSRVSIISVTLVLAMVVQAAVALVVFNRVSEGIEESSQHSVPGIVASLTLSEDLFYLRGNYMRHIIAQSPGEMDHIQVENDQVIGRIHDDIAHMKALAENDEERASVAKIEALTSSYVESWQSVQALSRADKTDEAVKLYDKLCVPIMENLRQHVEQLGNSKMEADGKASGDLRRLASQSTWLLGLLSAGAAFGAGLGSLFAIRSINAALRKSMQELQYATAEIADASGMVANASQRLAEGCSQQVATIEETSSASKEINAMAQRSAENSRNAAEVVNGSRERAEHTDQSLAAMVSAMERIGTSSQKISKIIKVIDEIAFQTNILALNAAVEAARAGDAGMGFAVVADEVRALAHRSAQAARDTSELIEDSIRQANEGKDMVDRVAGDIHLLTAESNRIKTLVDEINLGSVEQSRGTDQISRSIQSMETSTQSTAATAQESSSAAREMEAQSRSLKDILAGITILVEGAGGPAQSPALHQVMSMGEAQVRRA